MTRYSTVRKFGSKRILDKIKKNELSTNSAYNLIKSKAKEEHITENKIGLTPLPKKGPGTIQENTIIEYASFQESHCMQSIGLSTNSFH